MGMQHVCENPGASPSMYQQAFDFRQDFRFQDVTQFEIDCFAQGDIHGGQFVDYIMRKDLITLPNDPKDYPGLNHAAGLMDMIIEQLEITLSTSQKDLMKEHLKGLLDKKSISDCMQGRFNVGVTINGRWTITSIVTDVEGYYNGGINEVEDEKYNTTCIMKLLPTHSEYEGYAARELDIMSKLRHPNIIQFLDGNIPKSRHATPWVVMEFCDMGTLKDLVTEFIDKKELVPELFVWQIFESLVSAVQYCHHGPCQDNTSEQKPWDPVSHRDITLSNVFYTVSGNDSGYEYPYTVKLADFGCAITQSEVRTKNLALDDLPLTDSASHPPEGPLPSEKTDIYQIGLIVSCFYSTMDHPDYNCNRVDLHIQRRRPGFCGYSRELATHMYACLSDDPKKRPTAANLLRELQLSREGLVAKGRLKFEDF